MSFYIKCKTKIKIILNSWIYRSTVIKSAERGQSLLINRKSLYLSPFHRNREDFMSIYKKDILVMVRLSCQSSSPSFMGYLVRIKSCINKIFKMTQKSSHLTIKQNNLYKNLLNNNYLIYKPLNKENNGSII